MLPFYEVNRLEYQLAIRFAQGDLNLVAAYDVFHFDRTHNVNYQQFHPLMYEFASVNIDRYLLQLLFTMKTCL